MSANHTNTQRNKTYAKQVANQAGFQPRTKQHTQAKCQEATTIQQILPVHKNTP